MLVLALPVLALALAQGEPPAPGAAQPPAAEPPPAQGPAVEPEPPPTAPKPVAEPEGQAAQKAPPQRLRSALSGETLGKGGAIGLGMAGYPALGAVYLQAISEGDDLGGLAELDWAATDFLAEGVWRHAAWRSGGTSLGLRLAAAVSA